MRNPTALVLLALTFVAPALVRAAGEPAVAWRLVLAEPGEPGTRLRVSGRVLRADGRTPAAGVRFGAYHTDAKGNYGSNGSGSSARSRDARLSGWGETDSLGRFEIRTIRPAPYPGGRIPAHIHFILEGRGDYELQFADDPLAGRTAESAKSQVRPVRASADGTQQVEVTWKLSR